MQRSVARPKADLPAPGELLALADADDRLAVRVTPGAKVEGVFIKQGQVLVKTRAKPQDGAANKAVIALLAQALDCAQSRIVLLRGATSREKVLAVTL